MSESDQQAIDVLLPGSRVAVFSEDQQTLDAAQTLSQDWRFARVHLHVQKGHVESAIAHFQKQGSADLIIIQTDEIDEQFTERLAELSSYCPEGTSAVVIGPVNDVYLYRRLIAMGVSDYLVRPIKPEILSQIIAKTMITKLGVSGSRLIATIGAKGGVGTSVISELLAFGLSGVLDQKTTLLDAAGGWSSLSVGMGFDPSATLAQIIRAVETKNEDTFQRMLFKAGDKLSILAGGADAMLASPTTADQYEKLVDYLMVKSPVVLIDLSGADCNLKHVVMARANQIILVTTPTVTSLRSARTILKEIGDVRGGNTGDISLIINQQGLSKSHEVQAKDIEEALDFKVSGCIPFLPSLFLGHESEVSKILKDKEGSAIVKNILLPMVKRSVMRSASEDEKTGGSKKSGGLGGFLTKLTSK